MGASSVTKFCHDHQISRGTFYNLQARSKGPRVMKVGTRTLISDEASAEWRRQMEKESTGKSTAANSE
jgi:hypothetical protein